MPVAALERAFVVSFELRESAVTAVADVVLPVAPQSEKTGTYVNWEGRLRPFDEALTSNAVSDHRALDMLASEMGHFLETRTQREIHDQFEALGPWGGARATTAPDGHRHRRVLRHQCRDPCARNSPWSWSGARRHRRAFRR